MKVLQTVNTAFVVSLDIETCRVKDKFSDLDEGTKSAWGYKNKQDGVVPEVEVLSQMWEKNSALYAEFSKICAVSLTYLDSSGKAICKEFYGQNELELLSALQITLNNMNTYSKEYRLVGHAAKYFDYPYLCKRYVINGLSIPTALDTTAMKMWDNKNLCTNDLWKMGGTGSGSSLQALCNVLGIPTSKLDLVGDEVGAAYFKGEYQRIGRYCSLDTIATFNVIRRFKGESIFSFDEVNYITAYSDDTTEKEAVVEQPLLKKLLEDKVFTPEIKEEIRNTLKKKKATKKDKEAVGQIILACYLEKIDIMDYTDVKNEKTSINITRKQEVEDFIKSI